MKKLFQILILSIFILQTTLLASAGSVFPDVYDSEPISEELQYLVDQGVVEGYPDGTFQALNLINRAEFTKMVIEGLTDEEIDEEKNSNCFNDVEEEWFAKYICYAQGEGWVNGYAGNLFKPGDNITKSEAVKIIVEVIGWEDSSLDYSYFVDVESGEWYEEYIKIAEEKNLFNKLDYFISPHELISRKQMTDLLYRAMKYEEGESISVEMVAYTGDEKLTYEEVLETGIEPAYPSDLDVPTNPQTYYPYGCYGFSTKNLLEWKYGEILDIEDLMETTGWNGEFLFSPDTMTLFTESYYLDLIHTYNGSAEYFFKKLAQGELMVVTIPLFLSTGENIWHNVVAYSFDDDGVWISNSLSGGYQERISYDDIFYDDNRYTSNLYELRKLKEGAVGDEKVYIAN